MKRGTSIVTPFLFALACLCTVGCGSLSVEVAVLNPEVLLEAETKIAAAEDRARLAQQLPRILALDDAGIHRLVDQIAQKHFEHYVQAGETLADAGFPNAPLRLQEDFRLGITPHYEGAKTQLLDLHGTLEDLARRRSTAEGGARQQIEHELEGRLLQWSRILGELEATADRDMSALKGHLASVLSGTPSLSKAEAQNLQRQALDDPDLRRTQQDLQTTARQSVAVLSGGTVDADPLVAAVAGAPEQSWHRTFHEVWGRGLLGSFNMAIKMEKGPSKDTFPEFTLKGLTFDPSDVARMASRVTSQALALGARMAGVSLTDVSGDSTEPPGRAFTAVTSPLAAKQASVSAATQSARVHDAALQSLAVVILQSWDNLTHPAKEVRKAAIDAVKASFAALQPNLRSAAPAGNGGDSGGDDGGGEPEEEAEEPEEEEPGEEGGTPEEEGESSEEEAENEAEEGGESSTEEEQDGTTSGGG